MQLSACAVRKVSGDMTQAGSNTEPPHRRNDLPPEILEIIWPALQVGGLSGLSGLLVGGFSGVIRSSTPTLFALASGIQWFTLGSTFWASRGFVIQAWGKESVTPREKVSASAIAGGIGGTAGGFLRGRGNIIPGAIMFSLFGAAGQTVYNLADARKSDMSDGDLVEDDARKNSWVNSKWSPMKVLSDKEYEDLLREKLLRVNAEIALVDENIVALKAEEQKIATTNSKRE